MENSVIVEKLELGSDDSISQFLNSFRKIGLDKDFNDARAVFIKPNLTYATYKKGVTTRVEFIRALISALKKINDKTIIYVGEGEGGYNSFSMSKAFIQMGFNKLAADFSGVKLINLSHMSTTSVILKTFRGPYEIGLPEIFFKEIDFSISCPVPKVHCMTGVSLSYKNQWGCIPDIMRLKNHYMFDYIISKIAESLKFRYAFLDGKYGLDDNGPMAGIPVEVNWFVAANSLGVFDITVAEMMGVDWRKIRHLRFAKKYGFIPKKTQIQVTGDISLMRRKFVLRRNFWNFPALAAFRFSWLTYFFYFSSWSKPLHDWMYKFRKRPIE